MQVKNYRNDITALRAIAVLAVVIFHIFPNVLRGGFLGVDIFFVISGFLITSILLKQKQSKINLFSFYKKRILRITPALLVLLIITSIVANYVLSSDVLINYARSVQMATLGFANVYFWQHLDTSYFAPDVNTTLLLHLWSLGVEWQFYLLFPFIIIFTKQKHILKLLILLFIASIVACSTIVLKHQMFAYYMLPTRCFALLAGSIVGYFTLNNPKQINQRTVEIISVICLVLIAISFVFLNESLNLPNYYTLVATIASAVLIYLGTKQSSIVHKIISNKVFIKIGLWSYSIYLYHWVLVAFWHVFNSNDAIPLLDGSLIFVVSIILGAISYYTVEQPCLKLKWNFIICLIIFIIIPFTISCWFKSHAKHDIENYKDLMPKSMESNINGCQFSFEKTTMFLDTCIVNKKQDEPNILLWGDSNANHYILTLKAIADKLGFSFRNLSNSMCPSLVGNNVVTMPSYINKSNIQLCNIKNRIIIPRLKNYDVVILSGNWIVLYDINKLQFKQELKIILNKLSNNNRMIIIIGKVPQPEYLDIASIVKGAKHDITKNYYSNYTNKVLKTNNFIKDISKKYKNVYYVDFNDILCPKGAKHCIYKDGKNSLYLDTGHLSVYGSQWLGKKYLEKGIDPVWYKVKALYKDRTDIKVNPDGSITRLKK